LLLDFTPFAHFAQAETLHRSVPDFRSFGNFGSLQSARNSVFLAGHNQAAEKSWAEKSWAETK
jgi:hypothetical protein